MLFSFQMQFAKATISLFQGQNYAKKLRLPINLLKAITF